MNRIEAARQAAVTLSAFETQVDDNAEVAPVTGHGMWVQCWVLISNEIIDAILAREDAPTLPTYEEALQSPKLARILFDASKGGNVRGITENHRYELANVIAGALKS